MLTKVFSKFKPMLRNIRSVVKTGSGGPIRRNGGPRGFSPSQHLPAVRPQGQMVKYAGGSVNVIEDATYTIVKDRSNAKRIAMMVIGGGLVGYGAYEAISGWLDDSSSFVTGYANNSSRGSVNTGRGGGRFSSGDAKFDGYEFAGLMDKHYSGEMLTDIEIKKMYRHFDLMIRQLMSGRDIEAESTMLISLNRSLNLAKVGLRFQEDPASDTVHRDLINRSEDPFEVDYFEEALSEMLNSLSTGTPLTAI